MATGEELTDLIKDFASDLAGSLPDPAAWGMWLKLLMEELERQAAETGQPRSVTIMPENCCDVILMIDGNTIYKLLIDLKNNPFSYLNLFLLFNGTEETMRISEFMKWIENNNAKWGLC